MTVLAILAILVLLCRDGSPGNSCRGFKPTTIKPEPSRAKTQPTPWNEAMGKPR